MGISNPEALHPHALRAFFITEISNGNMNDAEKIGAARHKNINTTAGYMTLSNLSESHRLLAILPMKSNESKPFDSSIVAKSSEPLEPKTENSVNEYNDNQIIEIEDRGELREKGTFFNYTQDALQGLSQDFVDPSVYTQAEMEEYYKDLSEVEERRHVGTRKPHPIMPATNSSTDDEVRFVGVGNENMHTHSGDFDWNYDDVYSHERRIRGTIPSFFQARPRRVPSNREQNIRYMRRMLRREYDPFYGEARERRLYFRR